MKKTGILNLFLFLFCLPALYSQGTVTVTSAADDGSEGTLRWAILTANTDPTINEIVFDTGFTGELLLTANLPAVTADLTLSGPGVENFTISGENQFTMFIPSNGVTFNISGVTFTKNASAWGSGTVLYATRATINADNIKLEGNTNAFAIYSREGGSVINISNSTFTGNGGYLIGSDHGSTPNITSDVETDYSNRITVTGSTFSANTGIIFYTERYVKVDNCVFEDNTNQIAFFRGVNRYQVLNSTFTGNTGYQLFSFSSWIGDNPSFGEGTLGTNNTLFEGNTFIGNTGTVINPGPSASYFSKTTISDNIFEDNGTNWTGSPIAVTQNTLDNFFGGISHDAATATITVSMDRVVFGADDGTGNLEASDFIFSLAGGNATLGSSAPTSISVSGTDYVLGLDLLGAVHGNELLTITLATDAVYDAAGNAAAAVQDNNSLLLNFLDSDGDGVPDYLDECSDTPSGDVVEPNGCTDLTSPDVPTGLEVKARAYGLYIEWNENVDDTRGYNIYYGEQATDLVLLSSITSSETTDYLHTGLEVGKTYFYHVTAYDLADNESAPSTVISGVPVLPFIWDGPSIVFEKPDGADWTLTENRDYLTDNVTITRKNNQGLFNITKEPSFDTMLYSSPQGTQWAMGTTADFGSLVFSSWAEAMQYCPPCRVGSDFVVHLTEDDIYFDVKILSWSNGTGDFSYERSTPSPDADNDRVKDELDLCPATPAGEAVDANGCSDSQKDADVDGVNDDVDQCSDTPTGEAVDLNGCSDTQKDTDGDGVNDALDQCPSSPLGAIVDANGCSDSQKDADGDGVTDDLDQCPGTPAGETVDAVGCSDTQIDTDGDGTNDAYDAFPNDASEDTDSDGDGTGDNADPFPNDANEDTDSDGDGTGDNADAFPNDANEDTDSDGDGTGDNADAFPNDPTVS
ncbi:MAG: right-handed parallel beta-helix repeat-containing protein, partial [Sediminicola sp.]